MTGSQERSRPCEFHTHVCHASFTGLRSPQTSHLPPVPLFRLRRPLTHSWHLVLLIRWNRTGTDRRWRPSPTAPQCSLGAPQRGGSRFWLMKPELELQPSLFPVLNSQAGDEKCFFFILFFSAGIRWLLMRLLLQIKRWKKCCLFSCAAHTRTAASL